MSCPSCRETVSAAPRPTAWDRPSTDPPRSVTSERAWSGLIGRLLRRIPRLVLGRRCLLDRLLQDASLRERLVTRLAADDDDAVATRLRLLRFRTVRELVGLKKELDLIAPFVDCDDPAFQRRVEVAAAQLGPSVGSLDALVDILCPRDELLLGDATLHTPDRRALRWLLREILVHEHYYFKSDNRAPRILDCGSHFGLAIYYFKRLYPRARITAFEPQPEVRRILEENARRNGWQDVEILPYALAERSRQAVFHTLTRDSMGGSLTRRREASGEHFERCEVPCRPLSSYLDEPIDYLKLDVEGVEDVVLEEAANKLANVRRLFCEYHDGAGLSRGRLAKILHILHEAGFNTHVAKSYAWQVISEDRPMRLVDRTYSLSIWAEAARP